MKNKNDAYGSIKFESSNLHAILICVCGMPNGPAHVVGNSDVGYSTECGACGVYVEVDPTISLLQDALQIELGNHPGLYIDFDRSDIFAVLHCICGSDSQIFGYGRDEIYCHGCSLTYRVDGRLSIECLGHGRRPKSSDILVEQAYAIIDDNNSEHAEDPHLDAKVADVMRNPFLFWGRHWK